MKRVLKGPPPRLLQNYLSINPVATWDQMRDDNAQGGYRAAHSCRDQAMSDQGEICAYCEQKMSLEGYSRPQVEHFHQKSDRGGSHNWSLDWRNMLAVCDGGSRSSKEDRIEHPLPQNLSCDAHKNHVKGLPVDCEGYLLNPLDIPPFPNLFVFDKATCCIKPNETACSLVELPENTYETTAELVARTIEILNLNCNRLFKKRQHHMWNIDHVKKVLRQRGISPTKMHEKLIYRFFGTKWPEFFATLRCCLGEAVESYLMSIDFKG